MLSEMASRVGEILEGDSMDAIWSGIPSRIGLGSLLKELLVWWSAADPKQLVLLVD